MLTALVLAVGTSVAWGAADFFGGATRRGTPVFTIVAVGELLGLGVLAPVLIARGVPLPHNPRLWLAGVAGLGVTVELGVIYFALSRGEAFITAPVGALGTAAAVVVGVIGGDPVGQVIVIGLVCAIGGGGLSARISAPSASRRNARRSAVSCAVAAAGLATMLTCFHAAGRIDPYWATATEHVSTALSAGLIALLRNGGPLHRRLPGRRQLPALATVAVAGVGGDLAYAAASQHAALSVVSAISSLYPITTIALGVAIQRHRPGRVQTIGIILALTGAAVLGAATH